MRRAALLAALLTTAACETRDASVPATPATPLETPAPEFAGRKNPLPADAATVERGHASFVKTCAPCHGVNGDGKGPSSVGLDPPPANFHQEGRLRAKTDDFLFWRIATGKKGTAMPAFEGTLSEEERWAILRYLRTLQPDEGT